MKKKLNKAWFRQKEPEQGIVQADAIYEAG
jgi:hypothetical protein